MDDAAALRRLLDEREIADIVLRYCRGIDRMDRDLVLACYHPDAVDVHGSFEGDPQAFVEWVWRLLARYDSTMHFGGNLLVELAADDPERARSSACSTSGPSLTHHLPSPPSRPGGTSIELDVPPAF